MSFLKLHKLCSYLLAFTGLLPLLLSDELHPLTWFISIAGFAWSWRFEAPQIKGKVYRLRWTQITVSGFLLAAFLGFSGIFPNPILLGAYLLLLLQLNKLFNRNESKDYLHLYILSFLMLTLGTIVNSDFSYAVCFAFYVIFLTWTLTLFHLRREIEETYLMRHSEEVEEGETVDIAQILHSHRLVKGSFLLSTSLIALLVFAMSGLMFLMFPRIGFGLFFQRKRSGVKLSGFSDEVRLGNFGRIQLNRKVILRVEFPKQKKMKKRLHYYWRGMGYDHYDGWAWKRSRRYRSSSRFFAPNRYRISRIPSHLKKRVLRHVIYQEPLNIPILFGIDRVYEVYLSTSIQEMVRRQIPRIHRDLLSDTLTLHRYKAQGSSIRYEVLSVPDSPRVFSGKRRTFKRYLKRFLQLPKRLNPKVRELALKVTSKAKTSEEKARRIELFLSRNYKYSLSRKSFSGTPLNDFLFHQKLGHCEFFSTAMIMMLRSIGVPARQVTGFMGGSWNAYGKYYAVRQSDAHSWVEVYLPSRGWTRFDASPRTAASHSRGLFSVVEEYWDSLRLRWYKWVIEYDLIHQLQFLRSVKKKFDGVSKGMPSLSKSSGLAQKTKQMITWSIVILLFFLFGGWLWWRKKNARTHTLLTFSIVSQLYLQATHLLGVHGVARSAHETPSEYLKRLQESHPSLSVPLASLTDVYLQLRYNPDVTTSYRLGMLKDLIEQLRLEIKSQKGTS